MQIKKLEELTLQLLRLPTETGIFGTKKNQRAFTNKLRNKMIIIIILLIYEYKIIDIY